MRAAAPSKLDRTLIPNSGCAFAHWKNVAILVWGVSADGESARAATAFADELMQRYERFSVIHVSEISGLPTAEGREEFMAAARRGQNHAACVGLLLPHSGVIASMLLAFVRGIRTVLRGNMHLIAEREIKALVREFAPAHSGRTGVPVSMSELALAIDDARALMSSRSPLQD